MSPTVPRRSDLQELEGYHSPQVSAKVRLNTNESPYAPPERWFIDLAEQVSKIEPNRYPDRSAWDLRSRLADLHGVDPQQVFCANGSNEVLQCLLLAYGGHERKSLLFEPTYSLHSHISRITGTEVVSGARDEEFSIDPNDAVELVSAVNPVLTFLCSPNNPTGGAEPLDLVALLLEKSPGLVVVDEAYGQFSPGSALELHDALELREEGLQSLERLVVVRTFSKTWSLAAARLGYMVAEPEVVAACEHVALPYHLSAYAQAAGVLALRYTDQMEEKVALITEERKRIAAALEGLPVRAWHSDANFILFRPLERGADDLWQALLDRSVLIRNCSSWAGLEGCLRVSVGTPEENDQFLEAMEVCCR